MTKKKKKSSPRASNTGKKRTGGSSKAAKRRPSRRSEPKAKQKKTPSRKARSAKKRPSPRSESPASEARAARSSTSSFGKYVYCIIGTSKPLQFGPIGLGEEPADVHTVGYRDIAAVVSDTRIVVHDPTRANVLAHERVNETVVEEYTAIPMSFGTVFKTREDIVELLRSAYGAFREVLDKMRDKLEFGLKVLWEPDMVIERLEREDENVRRLKQEISSQRGSTYFARMQYGRLIDSLLREQTEQYVAEIFTVLRGVSVASRSNKPIGDKMILNAAFLVSRGTVDEFDDKVRELGALRPELTFKYTGPWPPYNFVNIRLKLERAEDR